MMRPLLLWFVRVYPSEVTGELGIPIVSSRHSPSAPWATTALPRPCQSFRDELISKGMTIAD